MSCARTGSCPARSTAGSPPRSPPRSRPPRGRRAWPAADDRGPAASPSRAENARTVIVVALVSPSGTGAAAGEVPRAGNPAHRLHGPGRGRALQRGGGGVLGGADAGRPVARPVSGRSPGRARRAGGAALAAGQRGPTGPV